MQKEGKYISLVRRLGKRLRVRLRILPSLSLRLTCERLSLHMRLHSRRKREQGLLAMTNPSKKKRKNYDAGKNGRGRRTRLEYWRQDSKRKIMAACKKKHSP